MNSHPRYIALGALILSAFIAGMALGQTTPRFVDVPPGHYAREAITWAVANRITKGCAEGRFCPDKPVTRAQMVTFLHRYAQLTGEAPLGPVAPTPDPTTTTTAVIDGKTYWPPNASVNPRVDGLALLKSIRIAPENCAGWENANFDDIPSIITFHRLGSVGYLTHQVLASGHVDHVVDYQEAWCSGIRDPSFGSDTYNLWPAKASVNQGKGGRDPLEWWNTDGKTTPRKVDYPGWCQYLYIHVAVKVAHKSTMDQAEYDFVKAQLEMCGPIAN